jgi:hypothetical protein
VKQIFLPVWVYGRHIAAMNDVGIENWWDEPPLHYPHALISYVHWGKPYVFPEGAYIFGDSGGFTLRSPSRAMRSNKAIDPVAVLKWQISLCRGGAILDLPPIQQERGRRWREWGKALEVTKKHTQRALPTYIEARKAGSKFRWWAVGHGNSEEEFEAWYREISNIYPFEDEGEGWAVKAEPNPDAYTVARTLHTLQRLGVTRTHFLAATGQDVTAVLFTLGPEAGLEFVTYDSAYAIKDGFNRGAFRPAADGLSWSTMQEIGDENHVRKYVIEECECEACVYMRARSEVYDKGRKGIRAEEFGGWMSTWLQLHNLCIQKVTLENQAAEASHDFLREILGPRNYARVLRVFSDGDRMPAVRRRGLLDLLD